MVDGFMSEKRPFHIFCRRTRSNMTRRDWMDPPGIASIRCNSGLIMAGNQSIDSSRSAGQPMMNEGRMDVSTPLAVRGGNSESGHAMRKKSDLFSSL